MTLHLQQAANRRMRRAVVVLVALVLALVAALVVIAVTGDDDSGKGTAPAPGPSSAAPAPQPTATVPDDDSGYVAPDRTVKLPDGRSKTAEGLRIGFPRTPEGGAAMAVASSRNAWSLDAATIRAGILAYAAAQYRTSMAAAAEAGAKGNRQFAGIPDTGPVPDGATLTAWPIGVQWKAVDSNTVDVLVLLRVTHAPKAGAATTTKLIVSPGRAVWEDGDWKGAATDPSAGIPDPVDVGTAAFNDHGWTSIQEGDRL
ncbi:hypothetical protein [Streptomyces jumonjinensis]|uniref:Uncharacterized protein n=1 Tax=Streptomyces jumonjinensis TaxID=1945 RepID=A0A646KLT7_STRJU|nr:hypothetical protein [Streptomyces jumonjinensis]MQT02911.1 hypothetical protein [Streptomyces jumonjinensis]